MQRTEPFSQELGYLPVRFPPGKCLKLSKSDKRAIKMRLQGQHVYTETRAKHRLPPSRFFFSFTMNMCHGRMQQTQLPPFLPFFARGPRHKLPITWARASTLVSPEDLLNPSRAPNSIFHRDSSVFVSRNHSTYHLLQTTLINQRQVGILCSPVGAPHFLRDRGL